MPAQSIMNRRKIEQRSLHHDFLERLHPSQSSGEAKLVQALRELWDDEHRRRRGQGRPPPPTAPKGMYGPPREHDHYGKEEKRWRETADLEPKLDERAEESLKDLRAAMGLPKKDATFDSWVGDYYLMRAREVGYTDARTYKYWLSQIRTAFEQTDAIFDDRLIEDEESEYPFGAWAVRGVGIRTWDAPVLGSTQPPVERRVDLPVVDDNSTDDEIDMNVLEATQSRMMSQFSATQSARLDGGDVDFLDDLSDGEIDERAIAAAQAEEDDDELQIREAEREGLDQGDEEDEYWNMDDDGYNPDEIETDFESNKDPSSPNANGLASLPDHPRQPAHTKSLSPQKRPASHQHVEADDLDTEGRPAKLLKSAKSVSNASLQADEKSVRTLATPSPSPVPSPRKRNPFASPQKKLRVDTPHNPLAATPALRQYPSLLDQDADSTLDYPPAAGQGPASSHRSNLTRDLGGRTTSKSEMTAADVVRALEDQLPDGMMEEDLVLTPTQVEHAPTMVPPHLRAPVEYERSSTADKEDEDMAEVIKQAAPTASRRKVMFDVPEPSPVGSIRSSFDARVGLPPTPTLPSSGELRPVSVLRDVAGRCADLPRTCLSSVHVFVTTSVLAALYRFERFPVGRPSPDRCRAPCDDQSSGGLS